MATKPTPATIVLKRRTHAQVLTAVEKLDGTADGTTIVAIPGTIESVQSRIDYLLESARGGEKQRLGALRKALGKAIVIAGTTPTAEPVEAPTLTVAENLARTKAAGQEAKARKAWREAGSKGTPPATPNLDAIEAEHAAGVKPTIVGRTKGRARTTASSPAAEVTATSTTPTGRLAKGALALAVLEHMATLTEPATASAMAKAMDRSAGAVKNACERLVGEGKVRRASEKPLRYALAAKAEAA